MSRAEVKVVAIAVIASLSVVVVLVFLLSLWSHKSSMTYDGEFDPPKERSELVPKERTRWDEVFDLELTYLRHREEKTEETLKKLAKSDPRTSKKFHSLKNYSLALVTDGGETVGEWMIRNDFIAHAFRQSRLAIDDRTFRNLVDQVAPKADAEKIIRFAILWASEKYDDLIEFQIFPDVINNGHRIEKPRAVALLKKFRE